jgi:hypothetical protein
MRVCVVLCVLRALLLRGCVDLMVPVRVMCKIEKRTGRFERHSPKVNVEQTTALGDHDVIIVAVADAQHVSGHAVNRSEQRRSKFRLLECQMRGFGTLTLTRRKKDRGRGEAGGGAL